MTLAVLGSGSLARAVCYGLAVAVPYPLRVSVGARSAAAAADLCAVAGVRATLAGNPVEFVPAPFDLDGVRPRGVLLCASTQSPWEGPSQWTALVRRGGFGVTLPLHAELAVDVGRSTDRAGAWFLNACYPDAVNPVLAALGIPVLAGIGNVATLAAALRTALGGREPALLAHHAHLHAPEDPGDEARAWSTGAPVTDVGGLLRTHRAVARQERNHITGYAAALLLRDLLRDEDVATHAPGPSGLPGGYPVLLGPGRVALRLPAGVTEAEAVALNQRWAVLDGVVVSDGVVRFGPAASSALRPYLPEFADGFAPHDLAVVTARLHEVRARLR